MECALGFSMKFLLANLWDYTQRFFAVLHREKFGLHIFVKPFILSISKNSK